MYFKENTSGTRRSEEPPPGVYLSPSLGLGTASPSTAPCGPPQRPPGWERGRGPGRAVPAAVLTPWDPGGSVLRAAGFCWFGGKHRRVTATVGLLAVASFSSMSEMHTQKVACPSAHPACECRSWQPRAASAFFTSEYPRVWLLSLATCIRQKPFVSDRNANLHKQPKPPGFVRCTRRSTPCAVQTPGEAAELRTCTRLKTWLVCSRSALPFFVQVKICQCLGRGLLARVLLTPLPRKVWINAVPLGHQLFCSGQPSHMAPTHFFTRFLCLVGPSVHPQHDHSNVLFSAVATSYRFAAGRSEVSDFCCVSLATHCNFPWAPHNPLRVSAMRICLEKVTFFALGYIAKCFLLITIHRGIYKLHALYQVS